MRKWLEDIRREKHMSQLDVAQMADITVQYYSHIENGIRRPSVVVAKAIACSLGFDWTRFFDDGHTNESA